MIVEKEFPKNLFEFLPDYGGAKQPLRFVAVPGNGTTRWLLPTESKELSQVLESWTPYRFTSRIGWAAVRAVGQFGRLKKLPGVTTVEVCGASEASWRSLGWRWKGSPIPVIYLGTPGPSRKAVVHLVERTTAECRAVVKIPLTDEAKAAVLHEADVLRAVGDQTCETIPRLLHVDHARGLATQTFVKGLPTARQLTPEHWRALRSLILRDETTSLKSHATQWEQQVVGFAVPMSVKAALADLHDDTRLPACWEHGDFTPWNIRRIADGHLVLFDWEEARRGGLPLSDVFHFLHMQDFLFDKRPERHCAEVGGEAAAMGLSAPVVEKLEMACLVGAWVKCAKSKNDDRATFIVRTLAKFDWRAA